MKANLSAQKLTGDNAIDESKELPHEAQSEIVLLGMHVVYLLLEYWQPSSAEATEGKTHHKNYACKKTNKIGRRIDLLGCGPWQSG